MIATFTTINSNLLTIRERRDRERDRERVRERKTERSLLSIRERSLLSSALLRSVAVEQDKYYTNVHTSK
jgi:hypothetical protein